MQIISVPETITSLLCLKPAPAGRQPPRDQVPVRCQGQIFLLPREVLARAASISVDTLHAAGMVALGLHSGDQERLASAGFTVDWARGYRLHLKIMVDLWRGQIEADHVASATRVFADGPSRFDEAREILRELPMLLQAGRARDALGYQSADLSSFAGVRNALWEVSGKLKVPAFQEALLARGARPEQLARIPKLADELFEERTEQLYQQGKDAETTSVLAVVKAMALGDLTMLSTTARAQLPPEAWERYQLGRLLGRPERRDDPAAPPPEPTPVPQPVPSAGPVPVAGPVAPVPGALPATPPMVVPTAAPTIAPTPPPVVAPRAAAPPKRQRRR